jgi:hypothetical protein
VTRTVEELGKETGEFWTGTLADWPQKKWLIFGEKRWDGKRATHPLWGKTKSKAKAKKEGRKDAKEKPVEKPPAAAEPPDKTAPSDAPDRPAPSEVPDKPAPSEPEERESGGGE